MSLVNISIAGFKSFQSVHNITITRHPDIVSRPCGLYDSIRFTAIHSEQIIAGPSIM